MWTHSASIDTRAAPDVVWALLADVAGWPRWNTGIASIALHGPFATGSTFTMTVPDGPTFTSTLVDVHAGAHFVDETVVGDTRVVVHHRIAPIASGTRIVYATEIVGPDADEVGPMVTSDFPTVLVALKERAERGSS